MTQESPEFDALLERLSHGERQVLGELFDKHRAQLRRMIEARLDQRLNGRVSPSDILQEAYIDAQERLDHFLSRQEMSFGLWLRLITGQCLVDMHRHHLGAQMRAVSNELVYDVGGQSANSSLCLAAQFVAQITTPSHAAMHDELTQQLEAALETLTPIDREVLLLRHFEELSNNEVAEILGLQVQTASKRYVRALTRLKEVLSRIPGFFEEQE